MSFEDEVRRLCGQIVACRSERKAVKLARRMHELLHAQIEELRDNMVALPAVGPVSVELTKAS